MVRNQGISATADPKVRDLTAHFSFKTRSLNLRFPNDARTLTSRFPNTPENLTTRISIRTTLTMSSDIMLTCWPGRRKEEEEGRKEEGGGRSEQTDQKWRVLSEICDGAVEFHTPRRVCAVW